MGFSIATFDFRRIGIKKMLVIQSHGHFGSLTVIHGHVYYPCFFPELWRLMIQ